MGDDSMGRKISQLIFLSCLVLCNTSAVAAGAIVFDATNAPRIASILVETKRQVTELKGMSGKMEALNSRLGGVLSTDTDRRSRLDTFAREWGTYIDGLSSPDADNLSLVKLLGYQNFGAENRLLDLNQFLSGKLYPSTHGDVSYNQMENIKKFRTAAVERSSVNGVALAGEKKHTLRNTQRKIAELGSESARAITIHDDLVVTNKLLSMIASELTQQREILSQQLELMSAVVAQGSPIVASGRRAE